MKLGGDAFTEADKVCVKEPGEEAVASEGIDVEMAETGGRTRPCF